MTTFYEQFPVLVHPYLHTGMCAYELGNTSARNAIVFIGGSVGAGGPHTTPYIRTVARRLDQFPVLSFSVFEIRMRSSFVGYGTDSLENDVYHISALVKHLRVQGRRKIVLFGHSLGCQGCMAYTDYASHLTAPVDGFILLGPISTRESLPLLFWPDHQANIDLAAEWISQGKAADCLPNEVLPRGLFGVPMSAYRLHSLFAKGGDDDYFSSDLDNETVARVWGMFNRPVLVLHPEKDERVPDNVDQAAQNMRYRNANPCVSPRSGLIPGADHMITDDLPQHWLASRVVSFLFTVAD
ncbi:hypothetical protein G6O67_008816 [Ophiocordyceps sinensis]|uniref:Esterase/lipase superfamily protein n=1 Tax=Ophiocordyceps sinensis TaxID=72228 RepID=A0A8H4LPT3_9HYPO|nr:hypothetical protein G6O67_008816 [Ophiocordyceps sinensis]